MYLKYMPLVIGATRYSLQNFIFYFNIPLPEICHKMYQVKLNSFLSFFYHLILGLSLGVIIR
jgi:hypothetical protein